MKKVTLLAFVALSLHCSLHAQISKSTWLLGGSAGITSSTTSQPGYTDYTATSYTIAPKAGYFFIDHLAAGLNINLTLDHTHYNESGSNNNYNYNIYGFGPFVRYYFLPAQKTTNILLEVSDTYNTFHASYSSPDSHTNTFAFAAGPAFFLTPSVALEWTIGYMWDNGTGKNPPPNSRAFKTAIGFQVYLAGKHHKG